MAPGTFRETPPARPLPRLRGGPRPEEELPRGPGSATTQGPSPRRCWETQTEPAQLRALSRHLRPRRQLKGRSGRAVRWEINSTAFHQVQILASDAHKNEPGLM